MYLKAAQPETRVLAYPSRRGEMTRAGSNPLANQVGVPKLRIESISWDEEGWPAM